VEAGRQYRRYDVHEARTHLSRIPERAAAGEGIVVSEAGEPVAEVVPLRPEVKRTGRGSLKGLIDIPDDFDELPDDIAGASGTR
jgi:prevent-host-death family protein